MKTGVKILPTVLVCLSLNVGVFAQKNDPNLRQIRTELLRLHNEIRAKNGAGRLVLNEKLNIAAQRHAEDMCHNNITKDIGWLFLDV